MLKLICICFGSTSKTLEEIDSMAKAIQFPTYVRGNHHGHFKSGYLSHIHFVNHEATQLARVCVIPVVLQVQQPIRHAPNSVFRTHELSPAAPPDSSVHLILLPNNSQWNSSLTAKEVEGANGDSILASLGPLHHHVVYA
eukprot:4893110-Amphidinium_carterae.1